MEYVIITLRNVSSTVGNERRIPMEGDPETRDGWYAGPQVFDAQVRVSREGGLQVWDSIAKSYSGALALHLSDEQAREALTLAEAAWALPEGARRALLDAGETTGETGWWRGL